MNIANGNLNKISPMGKHLANLLAAIVCAIPALGAPLDDAARTDAEIVELHCHLDRLWESGDRGTSQDADAMLKLAARLEKKALEERANHGNGKYDSVHPESMRRGVEEIREAAWLYDRYCAFLYGDLPKDSTDGAFVARNYDEAISWYKKAIESKASAVAATVKQETPE